MQPAPDDDLARIEMRPQEATIARAAGIRAMTFFLKITARSRQGTMPSLEAAYSRASAKMSSTD
jgi:hypothetical protein